MTVEALRQVLDARPFRPFDLHIADSRTIHVQHPELIAHTGAGRTVFIGDAGEEFQLVDLLLVTGVTVNGAARR